ncbi:MAG: NAD-dependent epimerase/dehydratase family protein [Bacteroidetes bacterium]|nr:MAG: NAD-dependent epimerase/dehydratase family protein [Bacteroidota bacterium]
MSSKVLLTGASGFLGQHLLTALSNGNHDITTIGRQPHLHLVCNLASQVPQLLSPFDMVVHAAGKAHTVPKTAAEAAEFDAVNVQGTKNLCRAFDNMGCWPAAFVFISSVAVYGRDAGEMIAENHPLEGSTPYAKSKIAAEAWLAQWCGQHGILLTILRLPLLVGANAPGNLGSMVQAIKRNQYANIGGGTAKKSMVLAIDVANCIEKAAATGGVYNLTDGVHPSFAQLAQAIAQSLGKSPPRNIPLILATLLATLGNFMGSTAPINSLKLKKITATLTFDDQEAVRALGWRPHPVLDSFTLT